jgi:hypothetical protein
MNAAAKDGEDEASLVKLYMDLTGSSEASARSVYMFVNREADEENCQTNALDAWRSEKEAQPCVAKRSTIFTESDEEFELSLFGREGLAFAGK